MMGQRPELNPREAFSVMREDQLRLERTVQSLKGRRLTREPPSEEEPDLSDEKTPPPPTGS